MSEIWTPPSWDPPIAGTDSEHLLGALDRMRITFRWKAEGLDAAALRTTLAASSLTIGGLLMHLALHEDLMFSVKFRGGPLTGPWATLGHDGSDDWEFRMAGQHSPEELYALYDGAVERSRKVLAEALANGGLDQPAAISWPDGTHASLRRLVCDRIEEVARHTGHADLIREAIDGRVGEDPPGDWQPPSWPAATT